MIYEAAAAAAAAAVASIPTLLPQAIKTIECTNHRLMVGLHGSVEAAAMADAQALNDDVIAVDGHSTMSSVTRFLTPPRSIGVRTASSRASTGAQPGIHAEFRNRSGQQSRTQSDMRVSNDAQLELAIAECWFTNNLSDRSVETDSFARVILSCRLTTSEFKIPRRGLKSCHRTHSRLSIHGNDIIIQYLSVSHCRSLNATVQTIHQPMVRTLNCFDSLRK